MTGSEAIGSIGVAILLVAFFLNLFGVLGANSRRYTLMNCFGAALSCYASWLIHFIPFVVLEATWSLVAAVALLKTVKSIKPTDQS